jgi:hypothetical protein
VELRSRDDIPQVALDAMALIEDIKRRALADIAQHPGSDASGITRRIGEDDSVLVLKVLKDAEREGKCQGHRSPPGPWLWNLAGAPAAHLVPAPAMMDGTFNRRLL